MRVIFSVVSLLILLVVQLAFQDADLFMSAPNFMLAFLCILLLFCSLEEVLWLSLFTGILLDVFSGAPDGVMALGFSAAPAAAWYMGQAFFSERFNSFLLPFYVVVATVVFFIIALLVLEGFALLGWSQGPAWPHFVSGQLLAAIVLNFFSLIPAYALYWLQEKGQSRFLRKQNRHS
jgi:cell shape-determining protein MreD